MNAKPVTQAIAALAVFATIGTAFANDLRYPEDNQSNNTLPKKSRAEVRAELRQAYQQGLLNQNDEVNYPPQAEVRSARSRAEVREEAIRYVQNHRFDPGYDIGA